MQPNDMRTVKHGPAPLTPGIGVADPGPPPESLPDTLWNVRIKEDGKHAWNVVGGPWTDANAIDKANHWRDQLPRASVRVEGV